MRVLDARAAELGVPVTRSAAVAISGIALHAAWQRFHLGRRRP